MGKRKRNQADHRADLRGEGFIGLPRVVFESEAWRHGLTSFDRDVHLQILSRFSGYNNGKIVCSQREISEGIGNTNYKRIGRSIARQIEVGLLGISTESVWKERLAREYRLTYASCGQAPFTRPATNEYRDWKKNDADDVSAGKAKSAATCSAAPKMSAEALSAVKAAKSRKSVVDA
jgi:hypothetical protein